MIANTGPSSLNATRRSSASERTADDERRAAQAATAIKFGTDGWRAVIADDFTFENVRRVAGAIASYVLKHEDPTHGLIVGYDTRFGSPRFARAAAEVLAAAGIPIKLASDYSPTPAISFAVKSTGAAGGVVLTSSHNPGTGMELSSKPNLAALRLRRS